MAYVLGFFAADGSMIKNNRGAHFIEFQITDLGILVEIRRLLGSDHKISSRLRDSKWKTNYRLQIGSKEIYQNLSRLGFTQHKSNTLLFPDLPNKFLADFVRGYFDGDGNVHFKKYYVSNRNKMKWTFSTCFTSGSRGFLQKLHEILKRQGVTKGGFIQVKRRVDKTISGYALVFSRHDSLALFLFMYNNTSHSPFLKRKYNVFRNAIKILNMQS